MFSLFLLLIGMNLKEFKGKYMSITGITCAEVVDVFNITPYGCAQRLFYQKTGVLPLDACSYDNEQSRKGKLVLYDPFIFNVYTKTTKRVTRVPNPQIVSTSWYPFILGDTDRLQNNKKPGYGKYVPLEVRVLDRISFYEIRKNGLPDKYYDYMLHHLMIAKGSTWASVAFFCPDVMEMKVFDIVYDESTAAEVIQGERNFWQIIIGEKKQEGIIASKNGCNLCGYRHKCTDGSNIYTTKEKEIMELTETTNKINNYLKEE